MTSSDDIPFIFLHPQGWAEPIGYKYGAISDEGTVAVIRLGGVTGMDATKGDVITHPGDIVAQAGAAFESIATLMECASHVLHTPVGPQHLFSLTIYTSAMAQYRAGLKEIGRHYKRVFGRNYAPTELIGVSELFNPDALVEYVAVFRVERH